MKQKVKDKLKELYKEYTDARKEWQNAKKQRQECIKEHRFKGCIDCTCDDTCEIFRQQIHTMNRMDLSEDELWMSIARNIKVEDIMDKLDMIS